MEKKEEYKVLARKYRPQKFKDLVGQESLVQILISAITNDRLAHAYLLTGVRGVGKVQLCVGIERTTASRWQLVPRNLVFSQK